MNGDYTLCGWRVRSDWPLPELSPWDGDDRPVDVRIRLGDVPDTLPGAVSGGPLLQVNRDGLARFALEGVAAYLVRGGCEITIATRLAPDSPDVGLFLFGSVFGVLCHQRGLLPLHASCVAFGDRAFAFAGPSGAGKSTVAAALVAQGGRLVADDVTVVEFRNGVPMVLPAFPRLRLWQDALDALGIPPGRRLRATADLDKFEHSLAGSFHSTPIRLAAVRHLVALRDGTVPPEVALKGSRAAVRVSQQIYRHRAARLLGRETALFAGSVALAGSADQYRMETPPHLDQLLDMMPAFAGRLAEER
jgi:hypothetical protein